MLSSQDVVSASMSLQPFLPSPPSLLQLRSPLSSSTTSLSSSPNIPNLLRQENWQTEIPFREEETEIEAKRSSIFRHQQVRRNLAALQALRSAPKRPRKRLSPTSQWLAPSNR